MKNLIILFIALSSGATYAQFLDLTKIGSSIELDFTEGYVCTAEPGPTKRRTMSYGETEEIASFDALNLCPAQKGNKAMYCEEAACEFISFNGRKPTISLSVVGGQIGVRYSVGAKYICVSKPFNGYTLYTAEVPSKMEAEVYAQNLCSYQTGQTRRDCDIISCKKIPGIN
jgi:hypothetical protein